MLVVAILLLSWDEFVPFSFFFFFSSFFFFDDFVGLITSS